ncbi:MAG TPA: glycosyl hydrolase family 28-related protein [Mucilaginibacter sp.]|jgi:hypothetical protein|nr:glycosyl hydrolase family 28-related protein [Mucilaginibacter sp.]
MKRITALVGSFCLVALFSCKKDVITPVTDLPKTKSIESLALVTVNGVTVNNDTIPPSTAVDVKTYGAVGDGYHDDTQAIQKAINAQNTIVIKKGTYIINQTINMRSGVKIYGTGGATIRPGTSMSGKLLVNGRYFFFSSVSNASIINLTFVPSSEAFSLSTYGNSCIYITQSQNCMVQFCRFNFNQPYQHIGIEAIWCDGPLTSGTYIFKNICNTVGIEYAENGASGTLCQYNTVNKSHSNAINGEGNGTYYCTKNKVMYNTINNAGYNGVNDYGLIDGTIIRGNTITGTGKSPSEGALGEGIQAVAVNTVVAQNKITDAQAEYIEVAMTNKKIDSNTIIDYNLVAEGIVINTVGSSTQPHATSFTTMVNHNSITGCLNAIEVVGNYTPSVSITNNYISNPKNSGVDIISNAPSYSLTVSGNTFSMSKPDAGRRSGLATYAANKTTTQKVALTNNTFTYTTGSAGGAGTETAISTATNGVSLNGNIVNGNYVKNKYGTEVVAMNNNGVTYTGYSFVNNKFTGCLMWLSGFQSTYTSGNNFTL